jgi:dTDP-4-amino-4,6-dideoxygalactose transaminase
VARYLGADPVFVDIDPATLNMSTAGLEAALESQSKAGRTVSAIIPVHVAGLPCDMESIGFLSRKYGVPVVEDAAHAFPVRRSGRFIGTLGDAGVYSFYATKTITTGEGGMAVTDSDETARRIRVMRLHGIDRDVWNRYTEKGASWKYDIVAPGYKYNMTDLAAAIGRVQLRRAEQMLTARREVARRYLSAFAGLDFLRLPPTADSHADARSAADSHAWHLFIVRLELKKLSIDRDRFIEELAARGIGASVHFIPLHLMKYYRERYSLAPADFPASLEAYTCCISLPLSAAHTEEEIDRVIAAVTEIGETHHR